MNVRYVLLNLSNDKFQVLLKEAAFHYFDYIDREKCLEDGYDWFCEPESHITLAAKLKDVTQAQALHQLKFKDPKVWSELRSKVLTEGVYFPELIIDFFDMKDYLVLKLNCTNSNIFPELKKVNAALMSLPNEREFDYNPHVSLTYLQKDIPNKLLTEIISELKRILPRQFTSPGITFSEDREGQSTTLKW